MNTLHASPSKPFTSPQQKLPLILSNFRDMSFVLGNHTFSETKTFIPQYALSNVMDAALIDDLKREGRLPLGANVFVPADEAVKADWVCPGWFAIHEYPFRIGMRFPFPKIVSDFIKLTKYSPAQFSAMMWRVLLGVDVVSKKHDIKIALEDLAYQYDVRAQTRARFSFRSKNKLTDLIPGADATINTSWQDKFFFVEKSTLGDWVSFIPETMDDRSK